MKIADFGLSRILGDEGHQETLTGTHQVMGTLRYMAPEQLEGSHGVDHRADIYSLGVVFYEMLTGELPIGRFSAPSQKAIIDVRLDEVVLRTLEKEPQRRYQHASQVKSDVQSIATPDGSTGDSALARTVAHEKRPPDDRASAVTDLAQRELAGRMLLTRRQLMDRVEQSLSPLFRGQLLQVLVGVALIVLGVQCWARNTQVPHRVLNGAILHVYGVLVIAQGLLVCTRIRRIDYSQPVVDIRNKLDSLRLRLPAGRRPHRVRVVADVDPGSGRPGLGRRAVPQRDLPLADRRGPRFRHLGLALSAQSCEQEIHPLRRGGGNSPAKASPTRILRSTKSRMLRSTNAAVEGLEPIPTLVPTAKFP